MSSIKQRIEAAERELAEAKAELARMEEAKVGGNPYVFKPKQWEDFSYIAQRTCDGRFYGGARSNVNGKVQFAFRDQHAAQRAAEALNVMMELRCQPGAREFREGHENYLISLDEGELEAWMVFVWTSAAVFSGAFDTKEDAEAAIKAVGEQRIIDAINFWAGVAE